MLQDPARKFRAFQPVALTNRTWPNRTHTHPPIWMSTDLRDGNQSLLEPMNANARCACSTPFARSASRRSRWPSLRLHRPISTLVRKLIERNYIPNGIAIEVLTQAREHLIRRTMDSLRGAPQAIVHVYNATSRPFRDIVFGISREEVIDVAVSSVRLIRALADAQPETKWILLIRAHPLLGNGGVSEVI